jgi:gamma-glutamylcyclotransferase (GGCT)/AIG2-like uncharacterized protein YtfP
MYYFAYGSNMSIARLRHRVGAVERIGLFRLNYHDLRFHKTGKDGSGKCNAFETGDPAHLLWGAVFDIDAGMKPELDHAEGLGVGYEEKRVIVTGESGVKLEAFSYYATSIDESLRPYSWYLNHVVIGARESGVPVGYLERLQSVKSIGDPDVRRDRKERALHLQRENA